MELDLKWYYLDMDGGFEGSSFKPKEGLDAKLEQNKQLHRNFRPGQESVAPHIDTPNEVRAKIRKSLDSIPVVHSAVDMVKAKNPETGEEMFTTLEIAREWATKGLKPGEVLVGPRIPDRRKSLIMKK